MLLIAEEDLIKIEESMATVLAIPKKKEENKALRLKMFDR